MTKEIFYYDLYLGHAGQSPTAFLCVPLKMAALDWGDALARAELLGFDKSKVMRLEKYSVRGRNGSTVVQYYREDALTTDAYLMGSLHVQTQRKIVEKKMLAEKKRLNRRKGIETALRRMPD